jgi:hypothetical protein
MISQVQMLADRLRWIQEQKFITLSLATEVCERLPTIIHFLDECETFRKKLEEEKK